MTPPKQQGMSIFSQWVARGLLVRNLVLAAVTLMMVPQGIAQNREADGSIQGRATNLLNTTRWVRDPEPLDPFHQVSLELDAAEACVTVDETRACSTTQLRVAEDTRSLVQIAPRDDFRFSHWLSGEGYVFGDDTHESVTLEASTPLLPSLTGEGSLKPQSVFNAAGISTYL